MDAGDLSGLPEATSGVTVTSQRQSLSSSYPTAARPRCVPWVSDQGSIKYCVASERPELFNPSCDLQRCVVVILADNAVISIMVKGVQQRLQVKLITKVVGVQ